MNTPSAHSDARCELALSGVVNGRFVRVVMDRTFVEDGVRWIIDYKVGAHAGGSLEEFLDTERERYRAQMEGYASLMRQMDARPLKLGLYFPLLQAWRGWEPILWSTGA